MSGLDTEVVLSQNDYNELQERLRMLSDIALSATCLKLNLDHGFKPSMHALNRDLAAFQARFGGVHEEPPKRRKIRRRANA